MVSVANQSHQAEQEILGLCEPQIDYVTCKEQGEGGREVGVAGYLA